MNYVSAAIYKVIFPDAGATEYTISGSTNIYHLRLTPLGTPPLRRRIYSYPHHDGGIDQGFRLEPRRLVWELFVNDPTEALLEGWLASMWRLFKPYDEPIKLYVDLAGLGPVRQIDVYVDGPVDFAQSKQLGYSGILRVPLYAPNPLWYTLTQVTTTSTLGGSSMTVSYSGNHPEWPVVEIVGQIQDMVVTATMTNAYRTETAIIDLTGTTIADGDTYTIDLRPGRKTVTDSGGVNRIDKLVDESWPGFRLWPAPFKVGGSNSLAYAFTSKNANARLRVKYYNRYLSL